MSKIGYLHKEQTFIMQWGNLLQATSYAIAKLAVAGDKRTCIVCDCHATARNDNNVGTWVKMGI